MGGFRLLGVFVLLLNACTGTYIITTPRQWIQGSQTRICIYLTEQVFAAEDHLDLTLTYDDKEAASPPIHEFAVDMLHGKSRYCEEIKVPETKSFIYEMKLNMKGTLQSQVVDTSFNVSVEHATEMTYIQTDKQLYLPKQMVKFRILSIKGPQFKVDTRNYKEIWIASPDDIRLAQWLDVDASKGLIHLTFETDKETQEGTYTIHVKTQSDLQYITTFKIESYVLPIYKVTVTPPKYILGSDKTVNFTVCAKYTFGQPLKGEAFIEVNAQNWRVYATKNQQHKIDGCHTFTFKTMPLRFDDNNCHIRIRELRVNAWVMEEGTNTMINTTKDVIAPVVRKVVTFEDKTSTWELKNYLLTPVSLKASYPDKTPASNEPTEVCVEAHYDEVTRICRNFTTDEKGMLNFAINNDIRYLNVRAFNYPRIERNWNDVMSDSLYTDYLYNRDRSNTYSSDSNSALMIIATKTLQCVDGKPNKFLLPVAYVANNTNTATMHIQVVSRMQIVSQKDVEDVQFISTLLPHEEQFVGRSMDGLPEGLVKGMMKVWLELPSNVSPKFKVLVWYKRFDGEVVADWKEVQVSPCLPHQVNLQWSHTKAKPGAETKISITAKKEALCSLGVVDESVELLSRESSPFSESTLLDLLPYTNSWQYRRRRIVDLEFCKKKYKFEDFDPSKSISPQDDSHKKRSSPIYRRRHHDFVREVLNAFYDAGLHAISNLNLEKKTCDQIFTEELKRQVAAYEKKLTDNSQKSHSKFRSAVPMVETALSSMSKSYSVDYDDHRSYDAMETNLDSAVVTIKGGVQIRTYFPETWLWELHYMSESTESLDLTLPDSVTKWIGRAVCVHPQKGVGISNMAAITTFKSMFLKAKFPANIYRGEVIPVAVSVFNYLNYSLPLSLTLSSDQGTEFNFLTQEGVEDSKQRTFCIDGGDKAVAEFKVVPRVIGEVALTASLKTDTKSGTKCTTEKVVQEEDRVIMGIKVEAEGFVRDRTYSAYVCQSQSQVGAPSLTFLPSWNLTAPIGSIPDSTRAWVSITGDLMGPTIDSLGSLVRMPYGCGEQNMINFAPNVYILEYLKSSKQYDQLLVDKIIRFMKSGYRRQLLYRRYDGSFSSFGHVDLEGSPWLTAFVLKSFVRAKNTLDIDDRVINDALRWLMDKQKENGCFENLIEGTNYLMRGESNLVSSETLHATYILTALLEAAHNDYNISDIVINKAIECIAKDDSDHPYSLALKAYALVMARNSDADAHIQKLINGSIANESFVYWYLPGTQWANEALEIETAGYALLTILEHDYSKYRSAATRIVRWLSKKRNSMGGFMSTQDTVIALQGLSQFQKRNAGDTVCNPCILTIETNNGRNKIAVNKKNILLQQKTHIKSLPTGVSFKLNGFGCLLLQTNLRYNVLSEGIASVFNIDIKVVDIPPSSSNPCPSQAIHVCTSYTLPDGASNMAVMEIKFVSGYEPVRCYLDRAVPSVIKRYELKGSRAFLYLSSVTKASTCVEIGLIRHFNVGKAKPGTVKVYDYYQPKMVNSVNYTLSTKDCEKEVNLNALDSCPTL